MKHTLIFSSIEVKTDENGEIIYTPGNAAFTGNEVASKEVIRIVNTNYVDMEGNKIKFLPSETIQEIVDKTEFDYRYPCGANQCECYNNSVKINAIIKFLDSLNLD